MKQTTSIRTLLTLLLALGVAGCDDDSKNDTDAFDAQEDVGCVPGTLNCPCNVGSVCEGSLVCTSGVCITEPASNLITAADGGTVTTDDGDLVLIIPPGALAQDTTITISELPTSAQPDSERLATRVYDLGPDGTTFSIPATLKIGSIETTGELAYLESGQWTTVDSTSHDGSFLVGDIAHFTPYAGLTPRSGGGSFNPNPTCIQVERLEAKVIPPAGLQVGFQVLDCNGNAVRPLESEEYDVCIADSSCDVIVVNDETGSAFNASEEGGSASPAATSKNTELYTVLVLDLSNSISKEDGEVDDVITAAEGFVNSVLPDGGSPFAHKVAIMAFGSTSQTQVEQDFTADKAQLLSVLGTLRDAPPRGTTNLYGAYTSAINQVSGQGDPNAVVERFVVIMTDGVHEAGDADNLRTQALDLKNSSDVRTYSVAIGEAGGYDKCRIEELAGSGCREGVACIEGTDAPADCYQFISVASTLELTGAFEAIAERALGIARSNYVVGVCTPVELGSPSLTIEVNVDGVTGSGTISYDTTNLTGDINSCDGALISDKPVACTQSGENDELCELRCQSQDCGDDQGTYCGGCGAGGGCCGGACVEFSSTENCGGCGLACQGSEVCEAGSCVCPPAADTQCNGVCIDVTTNQKNCGACDNACLDTEICEAGACTCPSEAPTLCSGSVCADLTSSYDHCGTCENRCAGVQTCESGTCECPASSPILCQGTTCAELCFSPVCLSAFFPPCLAFVPAQDSRGAALGDLDGDGDLDAVFANYQEINKVYLNDGAGQFSETTNRLGENTVPSGGDSSSRDVALHDLDGDGDLDAVFANVDNSGEGNRVYLNDGNASFVDSNQSLGSAASFAVALGDVDADGDADAVFSEGSVYLNDGAGTFSDSGQVLNQLGYDVLLADVDNDQDLDVVSTGSSTRVFINTDGVFSDSGQILEPSGKLGQDIAWGDVDGDGDPDLVVVFIGELRIYLNDGSGVLTDTNQPIGDVPDPSSAELGDLNGDGSLDLVVADGAVRNDPDRGSRIYLNDGSGSFASTFQRLDWSTSSQDVALGDIDGDGDLDAVFANGGTSNYNNAFINER